MPPPVDVDLERLHNKFQAGFASHDALWKGILYTNVYKKLSEVKTLDFADFEFPANLWAETLIDFAVAYNKGAYDRERIMESLIPLYYGRTAGLVVESQNMDSATFEREVIQAQARTFGELKPYLIERWGSL